MTAADPDGRAATRARFAAAAGFPLDDFQARALDAIDADRSVLVAAPTGSGKTVVGEYAVAVALAEGARVAYTTPIKALSNQKYGDLVRRHGADRVGLLTGDNAINGDAEVVVMTTEVLRNMIYGDAPGLHRLRWVVLDEVHYLQDFYRGPVWEEVIIHAPPEVRLVCLSATVSNADELADWITTVRGPTDVVVEERRPVELRHLELIADRRADRFHLVPLLVGGRPNPEGHRYDVDPGGGPRGGRGPRRWAIPRRVDVVDLLAERNLLPAITFIFSRAGCDDAVRACLDAGVRLTDASERDRIRDVVDARLEGMTDADLAVLDADRWRAGLEAGVAAHHAGMVPPFKETVEALFAEGLVKAVFATETLALGINMPARTVVIERLTKFGGERHERLTPGQYTQLTGRAGRRGIDEVGHAIVLWSPWVTFDDVAGLAASRSFELTSAFRPTYNMAANLVAGHDPDAARRLLERSFAQFRSDRAVVRVRQRIERRRVDLARARDEATCDRGDVAEYVAHTASRARRPPDADVDVDVEGALDRLRPGDVIEVERGSSSGPGVVVAVAHRRGGVRLRVLGRRDRLVTLGADDFRAEPAVLGRVELPEPYAPNQRGFLNEVARRRRQGRWERPGRPRRSRRAAIDDHPVATCPDRERHVRAHRRAERLAREVAGLEARLADRSSSLAGQFDRLLDLLERRGHLEGWRLTASGALLSRVFHECDLLVVEALDDGVLDDLDPPAMAGVVAALVYERRAPGDPPVPWFPPGPVRERVGRLEALADDLRADEDAARLPTTRRPDPGFCGIAHGWASGDELAELLADAELSAGDFVRNVKQLIDLLRQLADVAPRPDTAHAARAAADALFRGVVEDSSAIADPGASGGEAPAPPHHAVTSEPADDVVADPGGGTGPRR